MSVDHLKSGGVQTEAMQTPDGLQVDDHKIHSLSCMVGGVHPESNQSVWGSVKYTQHGTNDPTDKGTAPSCMNRYEHPAPTHTNSDEHACTVTRAQRYHEWCLPSISYD